MPLDWIHKEFSCAICHKIFEATSPNQKVCAECKPKLREKWFEKRKKDYCPNCGALKYKQAKLCRQCCMKSRKGSANPIWKGGRFIADGYILVRCPEHHRARATGYVLEHIKIWEEATGKQLPKGWVIHHLNGNKTDNRFKNLFALPRAKHDKYIPSLLQAHKARIKDLEIELSKLYQRLLFPF